MTLLERISAPTGSPTLDDVLREKLADIHGALGLAVAHYPSGTQGVLVIDAPNGEFYDAEDSAMERLVGVRRDFPDIPITLLCVRPQDAETVDIGNSAHVYRFAV